MGSEQEESVMHYGDMVQAQNNQTHFRTGFVTFRLGDDNPHEREKPDAPYNTDWLVIEPDEADPITLDPYSAVLLLRWLEFHQARLIRAAQRDLLVALNTGTPSTEGELQAWRAENDRWLRRGLPLVGTESWNRQVARTGQVHIVLWRVLRCVERRHLREAAWKQPICSTACHGVPTPVAFDCSGKRRADL